jgi:hypothetical protein
VLSSDADLDAIRPFLDRHDSTLIHAELSPDVADRLDEALGSGGAGQVWPVPGDPAARPDS